WTQPVGMPYAFNTVLENTQFVLNNNAPGFVASRFDAKTNTRNIYAIVAIDPADEVTRVSGTLKLDDGMEVDPKEALLTVKNLKTGEIIQNITLAPDGSFNFEIKPGEYQVYASHDGYHTDTINLSLPLYFTGNYIPVNPSLVPEKVSAGDFLAIRNILFDFDKYDLTETAKPTLDLLKNILINYPDLKIEVAGYTDAKGSTEYNRRLADKRAQAVINYLVSQGVNPSNLIKKSFGKSNFAAVNTNPDGSDNPEGRKYNRRVTFGIVNPKTGVVLRQEAYTPEHLRQAHTLRYSIVLLKTKEKIYPGYFNNLIKDEMLFVRTIQTDSVNLYALGVFYNRPDAVAYLGYLKDNGLKDAYIVNQYDLANNAAFINQELQTEEPAIITKVFSIQLKATKNPLDIRKVFPGYEGVKEMNGGDGFYKYLYGEFTSIAEAKDALEKARKDFSDAFIREINTVQNK
ncbi:MAG: OmpA family protein, partial [Bacteroidales bacterium]